LGTTLRDTGGTMALFYALLTPLSRLGISREWLRFPSVVFAMAAMPVLWATARRAFDRNVATLAALFTAGSWLAVRYAQSARSYALVLLLVTVSWWALLRAVSSDDPRKARHAWWLFTVAVVLAPLAHGLAILQLGAQAAWLAVGPDRGRTLRRARPALVGAAAVTLGLLAIGANQVASWVPPINRTQLAQLIAALTGPTLAASLILGAATIAGVAAAVHRHRHEADPVRRWMALIPIAWGLVPVVGLILLSFARPYLVSRYVAASAPGIGMLLALAATDDAWGPRRSKQAVGVVIALLLLAGQVDLHRWPGDDWAGAVRVIAAEAHPDDAVIFTNPSVRSAFDFAWNELPAEARPTTPAALSPVEPIGDIRRFYVIVPFDRLPRAAVSSGHDRLWVVDQDGTSLANERIRFLADGAVVRTFRVASRVELAGGVRVTLLVRR
jgi:mannosyltransferase